MRLLLDTHALIFLLSSPERMKSKARDAIADTANEVLFSAANIWEIEIKTKTGKLGLPRADALVAARSLPIGELVITAAHARLAGRLPLYHADPFDRVLIAQAQSEALVLVTRDGAFEKYDVATLAC